MLDRPAESADTAMPLTFTGSAVSNNEELRAERAAAIARQVESALQERLPDVSIELRLDQPPNAFAILWSDKATGRLHIWIPRGTFGSERTKFALEWNGQSRTFIKVATLLDRIVELCRPPTAYEEASAERRGRVEELNRKLQTIEGEVGSITRYLHVHRLALAAWLAQHETADVPIALRPLVGRLRELVEEAARLRGEIAANGE